jgi:hypothetical protein
MSSCIGVYARLRPEDEQLEASSAGLERVKVIRSYEPELMQTQVLVRNLEFSLDWVFDSDAPQESVYHIVGRQRVGRVVEGYNVAIIAYGQTGSGKTHTMFGPEEVLTDWQAALPEMHGLALRAISDLFAATDASASASAPVPAGGASEHVVEHGRWSVGCSFVEVYNDCVNDLLGGRKALPMREGPNGVDIQGLTVEEAPSVAAAMQALTRGSSNRTVAQMRMNLRSSRSHAVFSLSLRGQTNGDITTGKLVLVDLAGMESSKKSCSIEGASTAPQRREEAKHINTSLYALGTVIESLSASARPGARERRGSATHVPFRNSKLTRLLQECLHGNVASAFVTLRGESRELDECASTLRFAQRARAVPVVVRANVEAAPLDPVKLGAELKAVTGELRQAQTLIEKLQREMAEQQAAAAASSGGDRGGGAGGWPRQATVALLEDNDEERRRTISSEKMLAAKLHVGQLAEQMTDLVEQTKDGASSTAAAFAPPPPSLPESPAGASDGGGDAAVAAIDAELAALDALEQARQSGEDEQRISKLHAFALFARSQTEALEEALATMGLQMGSAASEARWGGAGSEQRGSQHQQGTALPLAQSGLPERSPQPYATGPQGQTGAPERPPSALTSAALRASVMEAQALADLGELFPLAPSELRAVLERSDWDVNAAAGELMDLGLQVGTDA